MKTLNNSTVTKPILTIIAGVNGSGKTTFALEFFKNTPITFINADLIATGLSSNNPDMSQFLAGKLMLKEIKKQCINKKSFAIETTLASKNYLKIIKELKQDNWQVNMIYLYLSSEYLSVQRVSERVKNGGHNIKLEDIKRRYGRSLSNLINDYLPIIDEITCFDNSNNRSFVFKKQCNKITVGNQAIYQNMLEYKKC